MILNELQQSEFIAFESYIKEFANSKGFGLMLKLPYVDKKIETFENYLEMFMRENGYIDGRSLSEALDGIRPEVSNWVNFPRNDFRMVDLAKELTIALFGG
ncbi:MAG: hypothetical protein R3Y05_01405 [bacterium]